MVKIKALSVCCLIIANFFAMERREAQSGEEARKKDSLACAIYGAERFAGDDGLSPRSRRQKIYEEQLWAGQLESCEKAEAAYRLALIYLEKNRKIGDIIPLFESVLAVENAEPHMRGDAQYKLACLHAKAKDCDESRIRELLRSAVDAGDLLCSDNLTDARKRLAFLYLGERNKDSDDVLAIKLLEPAYGDLSRKVAVLEAALAAAGNNKDELKRKTNAAKSKASEVGIPLERLRAVENERRLLECAVGSKIEGLDKKTLAYAHYKLATLYMYGRRSCHSNQKADNLLVDAITSGDLGELQRNDAWRCLDVCQREAVQENIEKEINRGGLSPHDLALKQVILATAYKDDCDDYGDKHARMNFETAISSGELSATELAHAQYHLACLCDEHRGQANFCFDKETGRPIPPPNDDLKAYQLLDAAIASGKLRATYLADAQYRLARLLILAPTVPEMGGGHIDLANYDRAKELLGCALSGNWLDVRQKMTAERMLSLVGSRKVCEEARIEREKFFADQLNQEIEKTRNTTADNLRKKIDVEKLNPDELAQTKFRLACLLYLDCMNPQEGDDYSRCFEEAEALLEKVVMSGHLTGNQVKLANHILRRDGTKKDDSGRVKEDADWQVKEGSIAESRSIRFDRVIKDSVCEKALYEQLVRQGQFLDPALLAFARDKLDRAGRGGDDSLDEGV